MVATGWHTFQEVKQETVDERVLRLIVTALNAKERLLVSEGIAKVQAEVQFPYNSQVDYNGRRKKLF